jgi:multiple sugar transport system permease protein
MVGELTWQRRVFGLWLPLVVLFVFALFPFVWMAATSLKTNAELYDPQAMPLEIRHPSLVHYIGLLKETNFLIWTANTMLVALISTAFSLLLGSMLAYPLARMRFPGAGLLAIAVAVTYLVPQTLLFVPMADLINRLNLGNTLSAVILTYPTLLVPFCAWLLMGYFKTVPKELEEAALIDGASRFRAMTRVILPLCMPGFVSAGIFAFTLSQNEFLYALLFLNRSGIRTIPVGVTGELIRGDAFYWGQLMAGALMGSLPVALIYSFFVKYYVAGLTAGSVKG